MQGFEDDVEADDDGPIALGAPEEWDELDLGPDERDADLMDGSWEQKYYSGRLRSFNWEAIMVALGLLVAAGLIISTAGALFWR
ncbi:MAG: hypothetical protein ACRDG3_05270 [Tepidiformaceae bacterium]